MKHITHKLLIIILACIFFQGCDKDEKANLNTAWKYFSVSKYTKALTIFKKFTVKKDSLEAYAGAGWCELRLKNLSGAGLYFSRSGNNPDGIAGWTFLLWAQEDLNGAISKANLVLTAEPEYVFSHDPRITYRDLIWIQAASYLQMGEYGQCYSKILLLDTGFTANLSDPLIANILLAKLQSLGNIG